MTFCVMLRVAEKYCPRMRGCCDDPDVHLICINDFSSLTVYSNLLIMNLPLPMYVLPVVLCTYVCHVQNKGYLLTCLLTYLS